jgi:hypothetical protein
MKNSTLKYAAIILTLISFTIISCKPEKPEEIFDEEVVEVDHPIDNGYARIRVEMTSNYKEICDFRYYELSVSIIGQCSHADTNIKDRTTESIMTTPWVYEKEFHYHGDEMITIFLNPQFNDGFQISDLTYEQAIQLFANIKLYCNDELVKEGDMMVAYTLPYADY